MCESSMAIGKADKKAAVNFMLIMGFLEVEWLWSRVNSMFSDR